MLSAIIGMVLNALFKGLFSTLNRRAADKAKKRAEEATVAATTAREVSSVEAEMVAKRIEAERTFKPEEFPDDDPFGFREFNSGRI